MDNEAAPQIREDDIDALRDYLMHSFVNPESRDELRGYVSEAFGRFIVTLGLVPHGDGRLLEIGSNPWFFTLLLKRFRGYRLASINYYGGGPLQGEEVVTNERYGEEHRFPYWHVNVESDPFPLDAGAFQVVLFCEVLEHLLEDPMHALLEIRRVLAPSGVLILTTPNVARARNILRLLEGEESVFGPYSRYGPYGRHNREYTLGELHDLLSAAGFLVGRAFTADVHDRQQAYDELAARGVRVDGELGEYCFLVARPGPTVGERRPARFYA